MATVWKRVLTAGTDAGTPSAIDLTNATNIPAAQLTGTIADARMPDLTGDVTTSAGAVATTIADNAVTLAKMAGGTDGNIISYDSSGNPVAIATGSDGQVLTSSGAGTQPAFETLSGLGDANESSFKTISVSGQTDVVADEDDDTLTLVGAGGMTITTSGDEITFTSATTSGDLTGITAGTGITGSSLTGPVPTITLDLTELSDSSAPLVASEDKFVILNDGVQGVMICEDINLGAFNNDQNWTSNTGDITGVTIITDSGSSSKMSDTGLSADFSILGATGVGVTNSGNTATVTAVPGEIAITGLSGYAAGTYANASSVGASGIVTVGTISSGEWGSGATTIAVASGGTGVTTKTGTGNVVLSASPTFSGTSAFPAGGLEVDGDPVITDNMTIAVDKGGTGATANTGTGNNVLSASPTFTGAPVAPTASADTNTTQIATTAYVQTELGDYLTTALGAPKASPTFTGTVNAAAVTISGNLTVSGSTTTVLAEELKVEDNVIVLNSNWASNAAPTQDAGITVERGTGDDESFFWEESNDEWAIGHSESSNAFTVAATVCTAKQQTYSSSQTNSHGAFAIGSFQIDGDDIWMRVS